MLAGTAAPTPWLLPLLTAAPSAWREVSALDVDSVIATCRHEGVLPLVAEAAPRLPESAGALSVALRQSLVHLAAEDGVHDSLVSRLLDDLDKSGVRALVFKGADLAHSVYARPHLRTRTDTDVFVDVADVARARHALLGAGWHAVPQGGGDLVSFQHAFRHSSRPRVVVDLHWRLFNPHVFAHVLSFDEAWATRQPRPGLGPTAFGLASVHALLVALVHRAAHHYDTSRLIWWHDIHLLAQRCDSDAWSRLVVYARRAGVGPLCHEGLLTVSQAFRTPVPVAVLDQLSQMAPAVGAARYSPGRRHVTRILEDLRHVRSWPMRVRLLQQHVLPSATYMRKVYGAGCRAPLAWLYAARAVNGARRWWRRA